MKPRHSVRAHLLALVAVTVIPFGLLLAYVIHGSVRKDTEAAYTEALSVAHVTASGVQQFLAEADSILAEISAWDMVQGAVQGHCDPFLAEFPQLFPKFARVVVLDADGNDRCPVVRPAEDAVVDDTGREWYRAAMRSERSLRSGPHRMGANGRWVVSLVEPVRDAGGGVVGAIGLAVDLVRYGEDLERIATPPGSVIALLDQEGRFLVRTLDPDGWVGRSGVDRGDIVRAVLARDDGRLVTRGADGVERIYAFTTIPGLGWKVYAGIPVRVALAQARSTAVRSGVLVVASVCLVALFSLYIGRRIVGPVRALTGTTRRIAAGELDARAPVEGPGEIAEVAGAVNDMVVARARADEELRRREVLSVMGSLVAGVAHEVRNPLFGISATLDAFEAKFGERSEARPYLDVLRNEVTRLKHLMTELLEYGRPQAEFVPGRLDEIAAEAVAACTSLARAAGVCIERCVEGSVPEVPTDRGRLVEAVRNLVENALHYSPRGSRILVTTRSVRRHGHRAVEVVVEDSGPGFGGVDLERVFEPFYSRRPGGTGLGLSIVRRIVEDHGGEATAANRSGGGAAVALRIPEVRG